MYFIDINHFEVSVEFNKWSSGLGFAFFVTSFTGKRPDNFFITIEVLFWILEIGFKRFKV